MEESEVFTFGDIFNNLPQNVTKTQQVNSLPVFTLINGFNFFQLFLLGSEIQYYSNRLFAQQTEKYDYKNAEEPDFNLFNSLNNQAVVNHKGLFNHLLSYILHLEGENTNIQEEQNSDNDSIRRFEDNIYDRKNFIDKIKYYQENIAFQRQITFIELTSKDINQEITNKLMKISNWKPILFYTIRNVSESLDFPVKVLKRRNFITVRNLEFNKLKDWANKLKQKCESDKIIQKIDDAIANEKKDVLIKLIEDTIANNEKLYYQLSFIIGTKKGIPVLILFDGNKIVKICDNLTDNIKDSDDLKASLDQIYMLYYTIDGINGKIKLKNSSIPKNARHPMITETDTILRSFIHYKLKESWNNKEFNFIELIKETLIYPSFFGLCCGQNLEFSFIISIIMGTEKGSESHILDNLEKGKCSSFLEIKKITQDDRILIHSLTHTYGNFTGFVLTLPVFLNFLKSKKYDDALTQLKYLFGYVPTTNTVFFDLFVDFLRRIVNSNNYPNANFKKEIKRFLYLTVSNKKDLGFGEIKFNDIAFAKIFAAAKNEINETNNIQAIKMLDDIMKDESFNELFVDKIKIVSDNIDTKNPFLKNQPKYKKLISYSDFTNKTYLFPHIRP